MWLFCRLVHGDVQEGRGGRGAVGLVNSVEKTEGIFMKQTTQFGLNQWEQTDRILMEDFNRDNAKVEAALAGQAASITGLTAAMGNCSIYTTSYYGNGKAGPGNEIIITTPKEPKAVLVVSSSSMAVFVYGGDGFSVMAGSGTVGIETRWSSRSVTWSHSSMAKYQMNESGVLYRVAVWMM